MFEGVLIPFITVFVAEWGDKIQLASAAFATKFNPIFVFLRRYACADGLGSCNDSAEQNNQHKIKTGNY